MPTTPEERAKKAAYQRGWRKRNPDKVAASKKAYRERHPEKIAAANKRWREENPERHAATNHAWYVANRPHFLEVCRIWKETHWTPEISSAYNKKWVAEHPEQAHANSRKGCALRRARLAAVAIGDQEKIDAVYARALDPKPIRCYLCGEWVPVGERHVDHVWPLAQDGQHASCNLVIMHASCNLKKGAKAPTDFGMLL
jgi:5-methylcytosine-specific restriction endonuclease McrA